MTQNLEKKVKRYFFTMVKRKLDSTHIFTVIKIKKKTRSHLHYKKQCRQLTLKMNKDAWIIPKLIDPCRQICKASKNAQQESWVKQCCGKKFNFNLNQGRFKVLESLQGLIDFLPCLLIEKPIRLWQKF